MTDTPTRRRRPLARTLLTLAGLLAVLGAIGGVIWFVRSNNTTTERRSYDLVYARRDVIVATVNASGQIQPNRVVNLNFTSPGRVAEVLVTVGAQVKRGQALARLDARELEIRVTQARAQLAQAEASYTKLVGGTDPADLAAAETQLAQAEAQLRQTRGSVTSADIRAAEAQLAQARAQLAKLLGGSDAADLRGAEAQVAQAQSQLATQRDQLSAAKTNAQLQLQQAVDQLTQAQSRYATASSNWQYVQDTGNDPLRPSLGSDQQGNNIANTLNDAQRQQYADAAVQAEAAMHSAENAVTQAQVGFDTARQNEVNGIQSAEQGVASAQASLDRLQSGADQSQVAAAQAQVASAQASLDKLRGDQRGGAIEAAQAGVEQARINLERLQNGASEADVAGARAQVQSAQAALDLAELGMNEATLTAPFDGTVAEVNLKAGELPQATRAPVVMADLSSYYVDVAVDEIDVSRIKAGQVVTLTLDALPGLSIPAAVDSLAPLSTAASTVTSYQVRLVAKATDPQVRAGMSTNADIEVAREQGVLLVPRRAVRNDRGRLVVETPVDSSIGARPAEQRPATLERRQIPVQTGLSNEQLIQITGGLDDQTCVYVEGLDPRLNIFNGPPQAR